MQEQKPISKAEFIHKEISYYLWDLELLEKCTKDTLYGGVDRKEQIEKVKAYIDYLFSML
jgi:hypothetical protein